MAAAVLGIPEKQHMISSMIMCHVTVKWSNDFSHRIAEMADAFYIFSRSIFFNPEVAEQYNHSHDKYISYFMQIEWNIDTFCR